MAARSRSPRDAPHPTASFTWGNLVNLAAIPLVTVTIGLIGWYFLSSDTLKRHDVAIEQIRTDSKEEKAAAALKAEEEKRAREGVRNEFLTSQRQLVDVLNKLDTRLSVGEKQQETMSRQIEKIGDLLRPAAPAKAR